MDGCGSSSSPSPSRSRFFSNFADTDVNGQAKWESKALELREPQPWSHAGLSWPLDVVLRQRDSLLVAPLVPAARVEVVDSAEEATPPMEVQAPVVVAAARD